MCNTYPALHNKDGSLKHSKECKMNFGKKDAQCPRCIEMINGAPARQGWQHDHYVVKKQQEQATLEAIINHDCKKRGCGPVCTAFEW